MKAVSYAEIAYDDVCLYCLYREEALPAEHNPHAPSCPVTLARALLKEMHMPLLLYRVEYEAREINGLRWRPFSSTQLAFSAQEAVAKFADSPDPDDLSRGKIRNAKAMLLREVL